MEESYRIEITDNNGKTVLVDNDFAQFYEYDVFSSYVKTALKGETINLISNIDNTIIRSETIK